MKSPLSLLSRPLRSLMRTPSFTLPSALTLALGIGATAAIFSVAFNVMFKPLPYPEPERLVALWHAAPGLVMEEVPESAAFYLSYLDNAKSLEAIGLYAPRDVSLSGTGPPIEVSSLLTTHQLLPILGAPLVAGRTFGPSDDVEGAPPTVILAQSLAESRFGSSAAAIGQTLSIGSLPTEVVGVVGRGFRVLDRDAKLFLPIRFNREDLILGQFNYRSVARLAPDATVESASAEIDSLLPTVAEEFTRGIPIEMLREADFTSFVRPLLVDAIGNVSQILWVLLGTVALLLLIALANVANLFLVRAEGRTREVALRTALGAGRGHLVRQFLKESLTLSLIGGALGLFLAWLTVRLLLALAPTTLPRLHEVSINLPVVVFAVLLSLLCGLVFGGLPALRVRSAQPFEALKEGGRSSTSGRQSHILRHALVVVQVALALILLVGSGLMLRTFSSLLGVDPGFSGADQVLTFSIAIPEALVSSPEETSRLQVQLAERLERLPGVLDSAASTTLPMSGNDSSDALWVDGHMPPEGQLPPIRRFKFVTGDLFNVLQRPMIAGRPIGWDDIEQRRQVLVVTENLAREYWPTAADAIGKRATPDPDNAAWWEIVGVVSDVHDDGIDQPAPAGVYLPVAAPLVWGQDLMVPRSLSYVLRIASGVDPMSVLPAAEKAVWELNTELPLAGAQSLEDIVHRSMARTTFTMTLLGIAAIVALCLGMIGVYATLSYVITQRKHEFGVRIALGAQRHEIRGLVVKQAILLGLLGVLGGLGAAFASTRLLGQLIHGVSATDGATFTAVSVALLFTVALAALLAARRATSVDPMSALRSD